VLSYPFRTITTKNFRRIAMRKALLTGAIVAVAIGCAWGGHARGQGSARHGSWEYRVDRVPGIERSVHSAIEFDAPVMERNRTADENLINQRAAEGWELAAVGGTFYYFKRSCQAT
jgi:hypothetical protein